MMITAIQWNSLRPLDGSQHKAFEELCVQLAGGEPMPAGSRFVRKGAPDAGVECYWTLPTGDIRGWQAKFFRETPKHAQWQQVDESVEKALSKHDRLVEYTVCLPIDRADPKDPTKQSFMDQWNVHEQKWRARARQLGLAVEFRYWGQSEILTRLALDQHSGRSHFWFNKELFTREWFAQKLEIAIANAGRRYHPKLNVPLPISNGFRGLGRTPDFFVDLDRTKGEVRRKLRDATSPKVEGWCPSEASQLRAVGLAIVDDLGQIDQTVPSTMPLTSLRQKAERALELASSLDSRLHEVERMPEHQKRDQNTGMSLSESARSARHYVYQFERTLGEVVEFTLSSEALLANTPALLLFGNAGVGKTHLLCDVASARRNNDQPTLVILGEQFSREEPWSQILKLLGLNGSVEDFLGALNATGELRGCRVLIFIDALNEGEGIHIWPKHIAGMLVHLRRYPWIGIALSVRETYLDAIVPTGISKSDLVRVCHHGFVGFESLAVTRFFAHYKIATPGVPLMQPEFSNPLFLQLFCEGISNRGLTHVPDGLDSLTAVFGFFLDSVNDKLSRPDYLNFDPRSRLVHRAVEGIAQQMAQGDHHWLPRDQLHSYLQTLHLEMRWEKSLLRHLLSEGILSQDLFGKLDETVEGIRFSYERFTDHQIAKFHLDKFLDPSDPTASFAPGTALRAKIKDESACWCNAGLVSAFAIQLPERIGRELPELAPHCARFRPVLDAMLESLMWRKHTAYSDATLDYVNKHLLKLRDTADATLRAMVAVSTQPNHPYNAMCLHRNLLRRPLPERDVWWSIFLHYEYWEEQSPVKRLLDWAEIDEVKDKITDQSLLLMGTTLAWFLTSSNRFLRDRATKALVALFSRRIPILCKVLVNFHAVDDMYVLERLLATAYGCAMRSSDKEHLQILGGWCYKFFFEASPPPHILLRDYARGIIERAIHVGAELKINRGKIEPPYDAKWPRRIPSEAKLKHLGDWKAENPKIHPSQLSLYSSVMDFGDFARYIIGTNSGTFDWEAIRLGRPRPPSAREIRERFTESLSARQRKLWLRLEEARQLLFLIKLHSTAESDDKQKIETLGKTHQRPIERARGSFIDSLDQTRVYCREVLPKEGTPYSHEREQTFDLRLIQRFVLNRVFELGWTAERFGDFDREADSYSGYGRGSHKAERIGKKYQWLAYHEALARVADNFVFYERLPDKEKRYEGTWQTQVRDIDPSITIKKTQRPGFHSPAPSWWAPMHYLNWRRTASDREWLQEIDDLPKIQQALRVDDPGDGSRWLTLQGFYDWEEPTPTDKEWSEIPHRSIWFHLRSYIVRKHDFAVVFPWAKQQNYMGRWMPESGDTHRLFLGELFWSPAFRDQCDSIRGDRAWTQGYRGEQHKPPRPIIVTAQEFLWEGNGYDCSLEGSIGMHLPSPWLAESLHLRWEGREGVFTDATATVVARDPSVFTPGRTALLIRPSVLRKFLDTVGCEIFWTVLGEKQVMGAHSDPYPARNELSGAVAIRDRKLEGRITSRFRDFAREHRTPAPKKR